MAPMSEEGGGGERVWKEAANLPPYLDPPNLDQPFPFSNIFRFCSRILKIPFV
jgi:hypothetical protein